MSKFQSCLIRLRLQALEHLRPVRLEGIGTDAARLVVEVTVFEVVDYHAASAGIPAPDFHPFAQSFPLVGIEATRELRAELLEQL